MISIDNLKQLKGKLEGSAETPYPAWIFGSALLLKGFTKRAISPIDGSSGGSVQFSRAIAASAPTKKSCFTFGAAHILGGFITFDGDADNGAGFNFAWSTLYLIVNGKASLGSIVRGRVVPFALSVFALGDAVIYGKRFFWPGQALLSK